MLNIHIAWTTLPLTTIICVLFFIYFTSSHKMNKFYVDSLTLFILGSIIYTRVKESIGDIKSSVTFIDIVD